MILRHSSRELTENDHIAFSELISVHPGLGWNPVMLESSLDAPHSISYGLFSNDAYLIAGVLFNAVENEAELLLLATHPDFLKQGAATQLLSAAFEQLAEKGIRQVFLEVRTSNKVAIRLYQKLGFQCIGMRQKYYKNPIEDAEIYTLPINT